MEKFVFAADIKSVALECLKLHGKYCLKKVFLPGLSGAEGCELTSRDDNFIQVLVTHLCGKFNLHMVC